MIWLSKSSKACSKTLLRKQYRLSSASVLNSTTVVSWKTCSTTFRRTCHTLLQNSRTRYLSSTWPCIWSSWSTGSSAALKFLSNRFVMITSCSQWLLGASSTCRSSLLGLTSWPRTYLSLTSQWVQPHLNESLQDSSKITPPRKAVRKTGNPSLSGSRRGISLSFDLWLNYLS